MRQIVEERRCRTVALAAYFAGRVAILTLARNLARICSRSGETGTVYEPRRSGSA
jgi:hypothetical protein